MNFKWTIPIAILAFFLSFLVPNISAQEEEKAKEEKSEKPKEEKEKPEFPPVEDLVKKMEVKKGFFTLFKKEEELYALIESSQFKQPFFLAITISGGIYAGMQWDEMVVYWDVQDKNLLLIRPDLRHRAPKTTFEEVVKRTYPSTIIRALPIIAKDGNDVLVDFSEIFKSDLAGVGPLAAFLLDGSVHLNRQLSQWSKVKVFPYNVELEVQAAFTGPSQGESANWTDQTDGSRTQKLGIHFSLSQIPETEYKPRKADTRVGYFNTAMKDYSQKYESRTTFQRYIHRWNIEKADSSLEMSPPKKPIVFYIEKNVPYRFRRYVREGILEWNKAFEKIGIVDAVVVRQQTETDFADLDAEDVRYNFFRWTTHDMGFAAGPSRVHPLTGEILDADIIFDDSILRYDSQQHFYFTSTAMLGEMDPKFQSMFTKFSEKILLQKYDKEEAIHSKAMQKVMQWTNKRGCASCMFSYGMSHQLAMAQVFINSKGEKKMPEEFVGTVVKEVVTHEVGHTLGLYHNFKGSSWRPLTEINSEKKPEDTSGSIMDYNPINFVPKGMAQGHYVPRAIGPYDYWTIEYGYKISDESDDKILPEIAKRAPENGLAYGNDLYASILDPDPLLIRWDLGDDPIAYAKLRLTLVQELRKDLLERVVAEGEDFYPVRKNFNVLLRDQLYSAVLAARYIGGESLYWDHKGDPKARPPFVVVSAIKQREALQFLSETIFSENAFQFSPELLNHLAPGTWWHWQSDELNVWASYPLHENILMIQFFVLFTLVNPINLERIHNAPLKVSGQDVFTLSELLDGITKTIWASMDKNIEKQFTAQEPLISSTQRNLQRLYINLWIYYFILDNAMFMIPEDARTIAWKNLNDLSKKIEVVLQKKDLIDPTTLAHLLDSQARIQAALKAKFNK